MAKAKPPTTKPRLPEDKKREAVAMYRTGDYTYAQVGEKFGTQGTNVMNWCNGGKYDPDTTSVESEAKPTKAERATSTNSSDIATLHELIGRLTVENMQLKAQLAKR